MHVPQTEVILRHASTELARVTLPPGEYVIGRSPDVEIHADTALLSRRHAQLTINYDQLFLEDLGSSNGTFLNDQPVTESTRVFPNQAIRLGPDLTLEVHRQRAPSEPGVSLAPAQAAIRRFLPEELLTEKRYAIGSMIARGGMGAILDARQNATQRTIAMKVMLDTGDEANVLRFIEEAQVTAQLDHPNIVPIYELGVDEQDQLFYTMKFVRGITLKKVLELLTQGVPETVKKYPLPALLTIFQKACDAIAFTHSKGVIHRDLKPENIMLGDFGAVLVMDWGLAKVLAKKHALAADFTRSLVTSARTAEPEFGSTMAGSIMGTPQYMAPEQARGEVEKLDARADIYALGAILFHLLFLRPSVSGSDAMQIVGKVARGELEWPAAKELRAVPDSLLAVCRKALALDPAARYRGVEDLQRDLTAYQTGFATSAERAGLGKQLFLLIRRHKGIFATALTAWLLITALAAWFVVNVTRERNRAEGALRDLRRAAPTLFAQAQTLVEEQKLDEAVEKLGFALAIDPQNADYRLRRAHLLQASLHLNEAAAAYRSVLDLRPDESAKANLALCERLQAQWPASGDPHIKTLRELYDALRAQGRSMESVPLASRLGLGTQATIDTLNAAFSEWKKLPEWKKVLTRFIRLSDGTYRLNLNGLPIQDLSPFLKLRGLPISIVELHETLVSDLKPLAGLQLHQLGLYRTSVSDLSDLKGMPLEDLQLLETKVHSLEPLRGMALTRLNLDGCSEIEDLAPLSGMPLRELKLGNCQKIESLKNLLGLPIQSLNIARCHKLKSLDGLQKSPLWTLNMANTPISDLTPLHGLPLRSIDLSNCPAIRDLSLLADCRELTKAAVPSLQTLGLEKLRTLPKLERIGIEGGNEKPAADFWREYDAQQTAGKK